MKKGKKDNFENINLEIVFAGRSNVGKSSFIRELTGKKVKVGKRPGVTLKPYNICYSDMLVTDMPGFGFMSGVKDRKKDIVHDKIVRYFENNAKRIKVAVLIIDGPAFIDIADRWNARDEIPIDIEMFEFLNELNIDTIVAVNKIDKIKSKDYEQIMNGIVERLGMSPPWKQWIDIIAPVSVKKGDIQSARELIKNRLHEAKRDDLLKYI
ncbi:GTP-binding protein HSR1-related protein [Methanohalobium evestigatum Z-7303]|uniref:Probable GTP-binding protein EngB n=1 Tax=Methanohalobium evestigatum (strain ATCC BAA-1072 / DSM 3721 / NBRC 107634 / OCM 161 / Z-7303) TaxID=644295 RepID=D7EAT1_METEZ|nr:GTP-binding protein EngB [Methanohalobium evestigatum]ADI74448.1 GTP-binding protein HSR1-related protein [Methanohalobium evestigatum Z-7303]